MRLASLFANSRAIGGRSSFNSNRSDLPAHMGCNVPMSSMCGVSFEPGFDFPFPEGDVPPPMTLGGRALSAITVSQSDFMLLTKIPIIIYYGDHIPDKPSVNPGQEQWRIVFEMAKKGRML